MTKTELRAHGVDLVVYEATSEDLQRIGADGSFGWLGRPVICVPKSIDRDPGHIWKCFALPLYASQEKEESPQDDCGQRCLYYHALRSGSRAYPSYQLSEITAILYTRK